MLPGVFCSSEVEIVSSWKTSFLVLIVIRHSYKTLSQAEGPLELNLSCWKGRMSLQTLWPEECRGSIHKRQTGSPVQHDLVLAQTLKF